MSDPARGPRDGAPAGGGRTDVVVVGLALLTLAAHLLTSRDYGYFRDELYYLANGEHLGLGYVEHPPLIGLLARFVRAVLGASLPALRLLPALCGAATVWLAGAMARDLGGRRFAQALAAAATMLAPVYTVLFAGGAVAVERFTARRARVALRAAVALLVVAGGLAAAPLAKPLLPEDTFVRYAAALGVRPTSGERQATGRLPQFFADMHGWPELAATVARVFQALPPAERARACVFAQDYGQAGAIDLFVPPLGLPKAISGHNSYFLWGPRDCTGDVVVVIGGDAAELRRQFRAVDAGAVHTCADCMPYESHHTIWIARGLRAHLREVWPRVKRYI